MSVHTDVENEARVELETAVAEQLAALSRATNAPRGVSIPAREIAADDIEFGSAAWLSHLVDLQSWLRFAEPVTLTTTEDTLRQLTTRLAARDEAPESLMDLEGSVPTLSEAGLDRLRSRAERAVRLQQDFLADAEDEGGSLAAATRRWTDSWEEASEVEEVATGPVTAKAHIWPIQEFSDKAEEGKLNLSPSYQRGDVWPTTDAQMLIESILRGIPLPSVIILKPQNQMDAPFEVVDGKQRLTSILRFIGRHPRALEIVAEADDANPQAGLMDKFRTDYPAFRTAWKNVRGEQLTASREREYYFPFKLRTKSAPLQGELAEFQGKYYTQIRRRPIQIADELVEVRYIFERVSEYKIPVIEYSRATRRQIHEVFNLYNKQGKHLNAEEIRNALYHGLDLMRGLLVAAGDSAADDPDARAEVADFLAPAPVWDRVEHLGDTLRSYDFGTSRYRRTKVLSWLAATLLSESTDSDPKLPSTARHIDSLLQRVEDATEDPLHDKARVADLLVFLSDAVAAHAAVVEAWAGRFMDNGRGDKWQELQLVGSLTGVCIAAAVLGEGTESRLADRAARLEERSTERAWLRPAKTQTQDQWRYIARIALWVADDLDVSPMAADHALRERFGSSAVSTLQSIYAADPATVGVRGGPSRVGPEAAASGDDVDH